MNVSEVHERIFRKFVATCLVLPLMVVCFGCGGGGVTEEGVKNDSETTTTSSTTTSSTTSTTTTTAATVSSTTVASTTTTSTSVTSTTTTTLVPVDESPVVSISAPADGSIFNPGEFVTLSGSASDPETGVLPENALLWESELQGILGTGATVTRSDLLEGTHVIVLSAEDGAGNVGSASITITIQGDVESIMDFVLDFQTAYNNGDAELLSSRHAQDFLNNGNDLSCMRQFWELDFASHVYSNFQYVVNTIINYDMGAARYAELQGNFIYDVDGETYMESRVMTLIEEDGIWKNSGNQVDFTQVFFSDFVTCEDVDVDTLEPVGTKSRFSEFDERVSVYCILHAVRNGDQAVCDWFTPEGAFYQRNIVAFDNPSLPDCLYGDNYRWWFSQAIKGQVTFWNQHVGTWRIEISINGEVLDHVFFEYTGSRI